VKHQVSTQRVATASLASKSSKIYSADIIQRVAGSGWAFNGWQAVGERGA